MVVNFMIDIIVRSDDCLQCVNLISEILLKTQIKNSFLLCVEQLLEQAYTEHTRTLTRAQILRKVPTSFLFK